jgi:hypothetical protein
MGTITIQSQCERVWTALNDALPSFGVRWPQAELLRWHNDGQRAVVAAVPSANVLQAAPALQPGVRQDLLVLSGINAPRQLMAVHGNVAADGVTPGRSITIVAKRSMDERMPMWAADEPGDVRHYMVDSQMPTTFWVWPQPLPGARIALSYSATPADQASASQPITLDDKYANALQYYMLMRAHLKSANTAVGSQQVLLYQGLFAQELGLSDAKRKELDPNLHLFADGAGVAGPGA